MASVWHKYDGINTMASKGAPARNDTAPGGIHIKASHKGLLHKNLGIPAGKPISTSRLKSAAKGAGPAEKKRIVFAENARKWGK